MINVVGVLLIYKPLKYTLRRHRRRKRPDHGIVAADFTAFGGATNGGWVSASLRSAWNTYCRRTAVFEIAEYLRRRPPRRASSPPAPYLSPRRKGAGSQLSFGWRGILIADEPQFLKSLSTFVSVHPVGRGFLKGGWPPLKPRRVSDNGVSAETPAAYSWLAALMIAIKSSGFKAAPPISPPSSSPPAPYLSPRRTAARLAHSAAAPLPNKAFRLCRGPLLRRERLLTPDLRR